MLIIPLLITFLLKGIAMKEEEAVLKEKKIPSIIKMEASTKENLLMDLEMGLENWSLKMELIMKVTGEKIGCMAMDNYFTIVENLRMKGK